MSELTPHAQSNPERDALRMRDRALATIPQPTVYVNSQCDIDATFAARNELAHERTVNIALTNAVGNHDGEHQLKTWRNNMYGSYPFFPQVMARRGVPKAMYNNDIETLKQIYRKNSGNEILSFLLCCCTLGIYDCFTEDCLTKTNRLSKEYIAEMNIRYLQYNVTWNYNFIPYAGSFISYET